MENGQNHGAEQRGLDLGTMNSNVLAGRISFTNKS